MVYMYHSFLIHSSADGHLGCFHVLAIINSAVMNSGVHVSLSDLVSLVCMPRSGIAGSYGISISSFLRNFKGASSLHQVAKVSDFQLQHQSFGWIFRTDFLKDWLVWSPCSPRDSQGSSPTPQFKSIRSLALSFLYNSASLVAQLVKNLSAMQEIWVRSLGWEMIPWKRETLPTSVF